MQSSNRFNYGESFNETTPHREQAGPSYSPPSSRIPPFRVDSSSGLLASENNPLPNSLPESNAEQHPSRSKSPKASFRQRGSSGAIDTPHHSNHTWDSSHADGDHLQVRGDRINYEDPLSSQRSDESNHQSQQSVLSNQITDLYLDPATEEEQEIHTRQLTFAEASPKVPHSPKKDVSLAYKDTIMRRRGTSVRESSRTPSPRPSSPKQTLTSSPSDKDQKTELHSSFTDKLAPSSPRLKTPRSVQHLPQYKHPIRSSAIRSKGESPTRQFYEENRDNRQRSPSRNKSPNSTNNSPRATGQEQFDSFEIPEDDLSPSTTPVRQTPKFRKRYLPPSPKDDPPKLPTPPSDSESEKKSWHYAATPKAYNNGNQEPSWLPTPKPPGGWLQTPVAPCALPKSAGILNTSSQNVQDELTSDNEILEPETPARNLNEGRYALKTPKPPGGWQTPAPPMQSKSQPRVSLEDRTKKEDRQLLTPVSSLSKGSSYDPKTPHVPGGWAATPAVRKSVLKVRFNRETDIQLSRNDGPSRKQKAGHDVDDMSPSTPRRPWGTVTSSIRIVDSFGREQDSNSSSYLTEAPGDSQQMERVAKDDAKDEEKHAAGLGRSELLSHIRRGFNDLVEDIEGAEDSDSSER